MESRGWRHYILQRVILVLLALSAIVGAAVIGNQEDKEEVMGKADAIGSLSNNPEGHNIEKRSPQIIFLQKAALAKFSALWGLQFLPTLIQG